MENDNVEIMNGTESLSINPANGGELMPVNQAVAGQQPSSLEMAASLAVTMAVGYGVGKLCELLFDKVIGPTAKKVGEKFDNKMAKKAKKSKDRLEQVDPSEDIIEGECEKINDSDDNQDDKQATLKKQVSIKNSVEAMRRHRKH